MTAALSRRATLSVAANPDIRHDYLVRLAGSVGPATLDIRYVPDRWVVDAAGFSAYLQALAGQAWTSPEVLALAVLDDLNNELVPRWVQVAVRRSPPEHVVVVEDQQPNWSNPAFIARLSPL